MPDKQSISTYVDVAPRFLRSINISYDHKANLNSSGYIITPNVAQALTRISDGLSHKAGQRAFSLIGPYGTGKSAFALYLSQLLAKDTAVATKALSLLKKQPELQSSYENIRQSSTNREGFLTLAITSRRRPIGQVVLEGILQGASQLKPNAKTAELIKQIEASLDQDDWQDSSVVLGLFEELCHRAQRQGYQGVLLLVDEAGKSLEYALQDHEGGDVYLFQELAEFANRQQRFPVLFLITLHQMFDDYLELAEKTARAEWNKVQERFQTIQFAESAGATIQMIASALTHPTELPANIQKDIRTELRKLEQNSTSLPVGINRQDFNRMAKQAWPLHPTALLALPHIFRRLAQNERSIFSYLVSHEPFGFQEHLQEQLQQNDGYIRLHHIYAYLLANFETGLARQPHAKRLLEANDVLGSRSNLTASQFDLIRTIAMLNVLAEMTNLKATHALLSCTMPPQIDVTGELNTLTKQSILTYRRLDSSYRIWEGSDVDIEARMQEARRHMHLEGGSLLENLRHQLPNQYHVARKHSLETGAYRYFCLDYADRLDTPEAYQDLVLPQGAAGKILVLLPNTDSALRTKRIKQITKNQPRLLIAIPRQIDLLKAVVEEVACLRWVEKNTEELRDDRTARKELSLRLVEGEQKLSQLIQTLLDPRPAPFGNCCQWYWNGINQKTQSPLDVKRLYSTACDHIYSQTPFLRNELIARNHISSAAASARRCLLEAMLTNAATETLGIEGYPPERSIYESVLHSTGIHSYDKGLKQWRLQTPPANNPINLRPCWELLENEFFNNELEQHRVQDVFDKLKEPPYGLPSGVHPLLFTAFYLVNLDELFLYREGTFLPDPQPAHFELLQKRPDLFSVSGARLQGTRRLVVERLAKGLNTPAKTASVVRHLFAMINNLPELSLRSNKFNDPLVIEMRDTFLHARSPEELLFVTLPKCFDLQPFDGTDTRTADIETFFDNLNHCLSQLGTHADAIKQSTRDILLTSCALPANTTGWRELEARSQWLAARVRHEVLTPFLSAVLNGSDRDHNPTPALSTVAGRPFDMWSDRDIDQFDGLAQGMGELFQKTWKNYGDVGPELSTPELKLKNDMIDKLGPQLAQIVDRTSRNSVCAALRSIIFELEQLEPTTNAEESADESVQ